MEQTYINNNKNTEKKFIISKLNNTKILQTIYQSEKLLTKITKKETLLINQINSKKSVKKENLNDIILLREKLNTNLKSLCIKTYDQQFDDAISNHNQLKQKCNNAQTVQKKLKLAKKSHQYLLQINLTILKEAQQTQQLSERGLIVHEFSQLFSELYPQYELIKNESNELFLNIKDSHPPFITTITSYIERLTNSQEELLLNQSLLKKI
jgi:hypothetical protein